LHVDLALGLVEPRDVIRFPAQPRRQIAQHRTATPSPRAVERNRQRRPRAQPRRHRVEDHANGKAVVAQHLDTLADPEHDAAIDREYGGALAHFQAVAGVGAHDGDLLADRLFHHRGRRKQVVIEILLDNRRTRRGERHRLGPDLGRDILEFVNRAPGGQIDLPRVAH